MKYLIYARKSSEAEDRQAASIEDQLKELKGLNEKLRLPLAGQFYEARSAKTPGRPEFNKMVEQILKGGIKGIICWKLNRLARNARDAGMIIWLVNDSGLEVVTPGKIYTKADQLLTYMEFGIANQFVNDLSIDVKRGLKSKAEKGWLPSGAKPGYANDKYGEKGNKKLPIDPVRFPLMKQAWTLMLTGAYTVGQILDKLNSEWSYRTPIRKTIGGKPMCRSQLYRTFTDPFYYGEFEFPAGSGNFYKGQHQPMVTREEFDRVQILLGRPNRPRPHNRQFSFTGMITCEECGSSITAEEKWQIICPDCKKKFSSKNKTACPYCEIKITEMKKPKLLHYIYYHCTKQKNKQCKQKSITEQQLEEQIKKKLSVITISEKFKHWAIKYLNELNDQEIDSRNASIKSLQEAYDDVVKRLDNLIKLKISPQNSDGSLLNDEEFKSQKTALIKEKQDLESNMSMTGDRINDWMKLSEKTFDFAIYAKHWFEKGDVMTKKEIFQSLGSNMKLGGGVLRLSIEKPFEIIESIKKEIPEIKETIEPEEGSVKPAYLEMLFPKNPSMLPLKDLFCNHELEFDISLSDLKIAFDEIGLSQPRFATA